MIVVEVDLHVTNRCNLQCEHCVYDSGKLNMVDMSFETVKKLNIGFKNMGVKEVHITGGEPLLNKELFNMINYLHSEGYLVRLQSNGYLINKEVARKLKTNGVDHILISIDGLYETHNKFRGNSKSFTAACEAVKICIDEGIFTRVNTVVSKFNINRIKDLMKKMNELKVNQHSFFYLTPMGRGVNLKDSILSLSEWKTIQNEILSYGKELGCSSKIRIQDVFHEGDMVYEGLDICRKDNCLIMSNGNVYHCVFFVNSPYCLGNIYEDDILEIWNRLPDLLNSINLKRKKSCNMFKCGGGCPGMAFCFRGDVSQCDPRCEPENNLISSCIRRYRK